MYCIKCGATINEGEKFCTKCGAQAPQQNTHDSAASAQPSAQQPYTQQAYGQGAVKLPKKKPKALLISIGVLVVALIAIALFVWPGVISVGGGSGGGGFLNGNTTQTKLVNDTMRVVKDALWDFDNGLIGDLFEKPFDISIEVTEKTGVDKKYTDIDAAYDEKSFGLNIDFDDYSTVMLLLEDALYVQEYGYAYGLEFDFSDELSKSMTLENRLNTIISGMMRSSGKSEVDLKGLLELFLNSVSDKNIEKSGSRTTLKLDSEALSDALKTFSGKLEKDKKLTGDIENYIKDQFGQKVDIVSAVESASAALESARIDFQFEWRVEYNGGKPVKAEISLESDDEEVFTLSMGYEDTDKGKAISLYFCTYGGYDLLACDMEYENTNEGTEYVIRLQTRYDKGRIEGIQKRSGSDIEGSFEISGIYNSEFTYEGILKTGSPKKEVAKDSRFEVDTEDAYMSNSSLIEALMSPVLRVSTVTPAQAQTSAAPAQPAAASEAPAESVEPVREEPVTRYIGVILPSDQGYYASIIQEMANLADGYGLELNINTSSYDPALEMTYAQTLMAIGMDALIVAPIGNTNIKAIQAYADSAGIPVVFLSDYAEGYAEYIIERDYNLLGAAFNELSNGRTCVIGDFENSPVSQTFISSVDNVSRIELLDVQYSEYDSDLAASIISTMVSEFNNVETYVCLDSSAIPTVMETLAAAGFQGNVVCFSEESNLQDKNYGLSVNYLYFPVSETAEAAINAIMALLDGETWPEITYTSPELY